MKFYLSSYGIGDEADKLVRLVPHGSIGYIPNARDFTGVDLVRRAKRSETDMSVLNALGLQSELLDLREYFGQPEKLRQKVTELGSIFISGGNVFVLRQAMFLCGLDTILTSLRDDPHFLYAGYSAAGCVLAPDLHAFPIVDRPDTPYPGQTEVIWDGLGFVDFAFMPHWKSDHPESAGVDQEIAYCEAHHIPYRAVRDGQVIIIE